MFYICAEVTCCIKFIHVQIHPYLMQLLASQQHSSKFLWPVCTNISSSAPSQRYGASQILHNLELSLQSRIYVYILYAVYMLSSKIKNTHWAEKTTTMRCGIIETATMWNVAVEKQPQCRILRCRSYSEDSEGFGLKVTCNLWARRWPNPT